MSKPLTPLDIAASDQETRRAARALKDQRAQDAGAGPLTKCLLNNTICCFFASLSAILAVGALGYAPLTCSVKCRTCKAKHVAKGRCAADQIGTTLCESKCPLPAICTDCQLAQSDVSLLGDNAHSTVVQQWRGFEAAVRDRWRPSGGGSSGSGGESNGTGGGGGKIRTGSTVILYDALGGDVFTPAALGAMAEFERAMLDAEEYGDYCKRVPSSLENSTATACEAGATLLNFLHVNDAAHADLCGRGFCHASPKQQGRCAQTGAWGVFPCTSPVYDWREGTLAPEAEWSSLVASRMCAPELETGMMPVGFNCSWGATGPTAGLVRSAYQVQIGPLTKQEWKRLKGGGMPDGLGAMVRRLKDAQTRLGATPYGAKTAATATSVERPLNILWANRFLDMFEEYSQADISLAVVSGVVIALTIAVNTGSLLLTLAGMVEILMSVPIALFCWFAIGQKTVDSTQLLGLFVVLCIGADDIFVFSAFHPELRTIEQRFVWAYKRSSAMMLATSLTTCICLWLNATSQYNVISGFGVFTGFVILVDYLQVITWFAACALIVSRCNLKGLERLCPTLCPATDGSVATRPSTAFMRDRLAPAVHRARWPLVLLSLAMTAGGIVLAVSLFQEPEGMEAFHAEHPVTQYARLSAAQYGDLSEKRPRAALVYGLASPAVRFPQSLQIYDEADADYQQDMEPRYADAFDFGPAGQAQIVAECEAAQGSEGLMHGGRGYCLLNELRAHDYAAFPYASEAALRAALEAFGRSERYEQLRRNFSRFEKLSAFVPDGDHGLKAVWHSFNMTLGRGSRLSPQAVRPHYDGWRGLAGEGAFSASREFYWMDTVLGVTYAALENVFVAIGASCGVIAIVTGNLITPLLATLSIVSVVAWTLAAVFLCGYAFDMFAAILVVMVVGLAVDYSVHFSHLYQISEGTRYERAQGALHGVGVSILSGALTTGLAGVPLLFAHLKFYTMAGTFLVFVALFGVLFAFLQLIPMLMCFGPEGSCGELSAIWRGLRRKPTEPAGLGQKEAAAATAER